MNSDARVVILDQDKISKNTNVTSELTVPGLREDQI